MTVVSDTGPLNYLALLGRIDLLPTLFGEVAIPPAVLEEMLDPGAPAIVADLARTLPEWAVVLSPRGGPIPGDLGAGERYAIALAAELGATLLCDDGTARAAARRGGLKVTGTLGVLRLAHARGLLEIDAALEALGRTNFHHAEGLFEDVSRGARELRRVAERTY